MNQEIIKNIGIMRQLIEIGDRETLVPILRKSKKADTQGTFKYLWNAIDNNRLDDALMLIEDAERQSRQVALHFDPIVSALKVELHFQENELTLLLADRDDLARKVEQFQIMHQSRTGEWLHEMLFLRKEKLAIQAKMDSRLQKAAEEAEAEFNEINEAHLSGIVGIMYNLDAEQQQELKILYRRASMICHPDRVAEKDKEQAMAMFAELHDAYIANDLKKLRLIVELLEKTGKFEFESTRLDTADALKSRIEWVLFEKEKTEEEIRELSSSAALKMVESLEGNFEEYFNTVVSNLKNQIAELKKWHLLHSTQN